MFVVHFLRFMKLSSDVFTMTEYANGYGICTAQHSNANCKAERQKVYIKSTQAFFGNTFFSLPFILIFNAIFIAQSEKCLQKRSP